MKVYETTMGALNLSSNQQMMIDAKNQVQAALYKNAKKALEAAASQGAKLSGKYSVDINFDV